MEDTSLTKDALFLEPLCLVEKVGLYEIQKALRQMMHSPFIYLSQLCEISLKHGNFLNLSKV